MNKPSSFCTLAASAFLFQIAGLHAADETIDGGATVTVPGDHASPWNVDILTVGNTGAGTLNIGAGGIVNSVDGFAGYNAGANGNVTVSGAGATWNVTNTANSLGVYGLNLGTYGTGTLTISNGGTVTSANPFNMFGTTAGGSGKLTVTGAGSSFTTPGLLYFYAGRGELEVLNGATVNALSIQATGGGENHVTVSGAGSTVTLGGQPLVVRSVAGVSSSLTVSNGGKVQGGQVIIGAAGGENTTAVVTGVGSTIDAEDRQFHVIKGTLDITNGGTVVSGNTTTHIAFALNSAATVTISGENSSWSAGSLQSSVGFRVGTRGTGTLALTDGGTFTAKLANQNLTYLHLGGGNEGNGTLKIGDGGIAGVLNASEVRSGTASTSSALVHFNHTNDITFSPNITGTRMSVTKEGSGTTTLTGANTYTQATTVNEGALLVHGSLGNTTVIVAEGATFGGNGIHTGTISLQGTVSPGTSTGSFTTGAATFEGGAGYLWELGDAAGEAGTGWDLLDITGALAFSATEADPFLLTLAKAGDLFGFDPSQDHDFVIATAGSISGFSADAVSIDAAGIPESLPGSWSIGQDGNSLVLSYNAIPEPSAAALAALGLLAALRRRRPH